MQDFFWIAAFIAVLAVTAYAAANTLAKVRISKALMEEAVPYEALSEDYTKTLLILGDSTGVGVGADTPEDTVAGRLTAHIQATYVENHSKSGAAVEDLTTQIQKVRRSHYDYILVQIGGNDILAFHDAKKTAKKLEEILGTLPESGKTFLMSAGNVGGATIFPWFIRPFYYFRTLAFHRAFSATAAARGITYVNLYVPILKDRFLQEPNRFLSGDGLHPSSEGYGLWFERLKFALED